MDNLSPPAVPGVQGATPCYLMVVDILGFTAIIKNLDREAQNRRIADWLELVETVRLEVGVEGTQVISDTLFVKEEDSADGLARLLRCAKLLLERGLEKNFPLRGAIAHGEAAWGTLTYGEAVIEAHQVERALDWIGIACDEDLPRLDQMWDWDVVARYPVPKKAGPLEMMGAVTWQVPGIRDLMLAALGNGLADDEDIVTWEMITKFERTIQFGMYVKRAKLARMDPDSKEGAFPVLAIEAAHRALLRLLALDVPSQGLRCEISEAGVVP